MGGGKKTFPQKLHSLLSASPQHTSLRWSDDGTEIIVRSAEVGALLMASPLFTHGNVKSLMRQLNFYNFKTIREAAADGGEKRMACRGFVRSDPTACKNAPRVPPKPRGRKNAPPQGQAPKRTASVPAGCAPPHAKKAKASERSKTPSFSFKTPTHPAATSAASGVGNGVGDGVVGGGGSGSGSSRSIGGMESSNGSGVRGPSFFSPDQSAIMDRLRVIMADSTSTTQTRSGRISRPARRVASMHAALPKALKTKKPLVVKVKFAPPPSQEPRAMMSRIDAAGGMPTLTDSGRLSAPPARLCVMHNPPKKSYSDVPLSSVSAGAVRISAAAISSAIAQKPMIGSEPLVPLLPMDIMDVALPDDDTELHNMLNFFDVSNMLEGTAAASTTAATAAAAAAAAAAPDSVEDFEETAYQEQLDDPGTAIPERKALSAIYFL